MPLIALLFKAQIISTNLLVSSFFPVKIIHHGKIILSKNDDEPTNKLSWKKLNFQFSFYFHPPFSLLSTVCMCEFQ